MNSVLLKKILYFYYVHPAMKTSDVAYKDVTVKNNTLCICLKNYGDFFE